MADSVIFPLATGIKQDRNVCIMSVQMNRGGPNHCCYLRLFRSEMLAGNSLGKSCEVNLKGFGVGGKWCNCLDFFSWEDNEKPGL